MKKLLIILLFPVFAFSQTKKAKPDTCFTQQEILDISFMLDSLWSADDINNALIENYKILINQQDSLIKLDSVQLCQKDEQIALLNQNIELYIKREKSMQPKWYDKKGLWFGVGVLTTLGSGILINQLIK
jgi:hypothetical protein